MRAIMTMERRLQDLERFIQNMHRAGDVTDVKYDQERHRWYIKMQDGEGDNLAFKSDWLPWKSFAHGAIKSSVPPRKGMKVSYNAPGGQPEMAYAEPFHNGPDNPSPHDKQDEVVHLFETPEQDQSQQGSGQQSGGQQQQQQDKWDNWQHQTASSHAIIVKKNTQQAQQGAGQGSGSQSGSQSSGSQQTQQKEPKKLPTVDENGSDDTVQWRTDKDKILGTVNKTARIHATKDKVLLNLGANASLEITDGKLQIKAGGVTWTFDSNGLWQQGGSYVKHDTKNIGKTHTHNGVVSGGDITDVPT
jgi:hypothetical protein